VVLVFVDSMDLATLAALRYARSLRPTSLRAVHFVIDSARAERIRDRWVRFGQDIPFEMIDTPDRRLVHASQELVRHEAEQPGTQVTVVLPRRSFSPLIGRMLHDRTADKIAAAVSRIPNAAATIIPFDVESRVRILEERHGARAERVSGTTAADGARERPGAGGGRGSVVTAPAEPPEQPLGASGEHPRPATPEVPAAAETGPAPGTAGPPRPRPGEPPASAGGTGTAGATGTTGADTRGTSAATGATGADGQATAARVTPIGSLSGQGKATVEGRVISLAIRPVEQNSVLACEVSDDTGSLTALFYGRSHVPGLDRGSGIRLQGTVGMRSGRPVMINPLYELLG
jgi:hypothetical protein